MADTAGMKKLNKEILELTKELGEAKKKLVITEHARKMVLSVEMNKLDATMEGKNSEQKLDRLARATKAYESAITAYGDALGVVTVLEGKLDAKRKEFEIAGLEGV